MNLDQELDRSQQDQGSPLGPQQAPLRSQVSSLMNSSPIGRTASGLSPFTSPQGLGSLAPAVLPGLWRRASLPSQVTLQQQMSSLGQAYLPEDSLDSMAQLFHMVVHSTCQGRLNKHKALEVTMMRLLLAVNLSSCGLNAVLM